jgi:hypothetical protein
MAAGESGSGVLQPGDGQDRSGIPEPGDSVPPDIEDQEPAPADLQVQGMSGISCPSRRSDAVSRSACTSLGAAWRQA